MTKTMTLIQLARGGELDQFIKYIKKASSKLINKILL